MKTMKLLTLDCSGKLVSLLNPSPTTAIRMLKQPCLKGQSACLAEIEIARAAATVTGLEVETEEIKLQSQAWHQSHAGCTTNTSLIAMIRTETITSLDRSQVAGTGAL